MSLFYYSISLFSILFLVVIRHSFYAAKLQKKISLIVFLFHQTFDLILRWEQLFQAVLNLLIGGYTHGFHIIL